MEIRVRIDSKTARRVFNGDFDSLPLSIITDSSEKYINKKDLQENYFRGKHIRKGDFKGLREMEIRVKKSEAYLNGKDLYSAFIMEKLHDNKWYIQVQNYINNYMKSGTLFTFTDETNDDMIDRQL